VHQEVGLLEAVLVEEQLEPFAGGELARGVLARRGLGPAPGPGALDPGPHLLELTLSRVLVASLLGLAHGYQVPPWSTNTERKASTTLGS